MMHPTGKHQKAAELFESKPSVVWVLCVTFYRYQQAHYPRPVRKIKKRTQSSENELVPFEMSSVLFWQDYSTIANYCNETVHIFSKPTMEQCGHATMYMWADIKGTLNVGWRSLAWYYRWRHYCNFGARNAFEMVDEFITGHAKNSSVRKKEHVLIYVFMIFWTRASWKVINCAKQLNKWGRRGYVCLSV